MNQLLAVVAVDLAGSTELTNRDRDLAFRTIDELIAQISSATAKHDGRVVNETGDGALLAFSSLGSALLAALELVAWARGSSLTIRVGISVGEVRLKGGDLKGSAANLASRLEKEAGPNSILVDETSFVVLQGDTRFHAESQGEVSLKGFSDPIRVSRIELAKPGDQPRKLALQTPDDLPLPDPDSPRTIVGLKSGSFIKGASKRPVTGEHERGHQPPRLALQAPDDLPLPDPDSLRTIVGPKPDSFTTGASNRPGTSEHERKKAWDRANDWVAGIVSSLPGSDWALSRQSWNNGKGFKKCYWGKVHPGHELGDLYNVGVQIAPRLEYVQEYGQQVRYFGDTAAIAVFVNTFDDKAEKLLGSRPEDYKALDEAYRSAMRRAFETHQTEWADANVLVRWRPNPLVDRNHLDSIEAFQRELELGRVDWRENRPDFWSPPLTIEDALANPLATSQLIFAHLRAFGPIIEETYRQFDRGAHHRRQAISDTPNAKRSIEKGEDTASIEPLVPPSGLVDSPLVEGSAPAAPTSDAPRWDAFIAYSSANRKEAEALRDAFDQVGLKAFLDQHGLRGGEAWDAQLNKAIKASRVLVLLFSEHSNKSQWVLQEVRVATKAGVPKYVVHLDPNVLPYREALEMHLEGIQWTPFDDKPHDVVEEIRLYLKSME